MNILFISNQNNNEWSGPTYSIPKQVKALSSIDNVFWYNINYDRREEWDKTGCYYNLSDFPSSTIRDLPSPFNRPDVAVIEQFYPFARSGIINELIRRKIKYVIIPRGELTLSAQKRKRIKKEIANALIFKRYAKRASAIIYLTENEKLQSGNKWNNNSYVISNGVDIPTYRKSFDQQSEIIHGVTIGRLSPYQKGLDILIDACAVNKELIQKTNCHIDIFGPDYDNEKLSLESNVNKAGLSEYIHFHEGIFGNDKIEVLKNSDVFFMPSRFEGHPMALIEALSYGLPCVVTEGSNMKSEIDIFQAGWTSENQSSSYAKAINKMLTERNNFDFYSQNASRLAHEYDWNTIANTTHNCFKVILKGE